MSTCNTCKGEYEPYGQRRPICKPCKRAYDRDYHAKRSSDKKDHKLQLQAKRVIANRQFVWDYLSDHPCENCGEDDPVVLEFDHIDQSTKEAVVSNLTTYSIDRMKKEIAKCRVLCANCHRRHTAIQLGWYKGIL